MAGRFCAAIAFEQNRCLTRWHPRSPSDLKTAGKSIFPTFDLLLTDTSTGNGVTNKVI